MTKTECLINENEYAIQLTNKDSNVSEYLSNKLIISNLINYIQWKLFDKERCVNSSLLVLMQSNK